MIFGFTGTRRGMTSHQNAAIVDLLRHLDADGEQVNGVEHGDCIGADDEFHHIVRAINPSIIIVVHPPSNSRFRAYCHGDVILPTQDYMTRNAAIVAACDRMIATPYEMSEQPRGGTWSTVRKARKAGKPVTIVWPDGTVG